MRILMLTHERGMRGGEKQLLLLARGLASRGHEVALGAPRGVELASQFRGRVFAIPMANAIDLRAPFAIRKAMREFQPQLVHAFTSRAHALAQLARARPLIVTRAVSFGSSGAKYRRGVERFIAVSEATRRALVEGGADPERIRVVPVGVEPQVVAGPSLRPSDAGFVIAAAGALEPAKGFDVLFEAMQQLPEVTLLLAGPGQERAKFVPKRVKLLGWMPGIGQLLASVDAFVLSSRSEGMPLVLIEAMAARLPIVATDVGGVREVVTHEQHALVVPSEDPSALAKAIRRLASDPALAKRLGDAARERAKNFGVETMVERTLAVYLEALGDSQRSQE